MIRPMAFTLTVLLVSALTCFAQEEKRPERMEQAGNSDERNEQAATTTQPGDQKPRLPGMSPDGLMVLHNQWSLNPTGHHILLGDFPVNIALHPKGRLAAVLHCGQSTHEVIVVDLKERKITSRVTIPEAFYGICFNADGSQLFASGGEYDVVHHWRVDAEGLLFEHKKIRIVPQEESFVVGGVTMSADGNEIYACGPWGDKLAIASLDEKTEPRFISFDKDSYPYAALRATSDNRLFVSLWGGAAVAVVDVAEGKVTGRWETPSHPTEMVLSPDEKTLYVACSNSNNVAVLDVTSGKTLEVINSALFPSAPTGSTPNSLALSHDGAILLVANADNNNLAVINVATRGQARPLGFIPTSWYPTSVRFDRKGNILVAGGKGISARANRQGPQPGVHGIREYIGSLHTGSLSWIDFPKPDALAQFTAEAYRCSPLREGSIVAAKPREKDNPIPEAVGGLSPIKHCIYVVKENRTYDQVLGDMTEGNGDASICIFPEEVTPNHHALAREFVLLDNFYVESEVSADGHEWSMAAYATDFVEKSWPLNYRSQPKTAEIKYPSEGEYDIAIPAGGYIWDRCKEAGVSYRSYGEWVDNGPTPDAPCKAKVPALEGHFDPYFRSYDLKVSDLKRADRFIEELNRFEKEGDMPQFIILRLPNDHTAGTRVGELTPTAYLAQNDLALGKVVEAVSRSRFWKDTAIFVVEDDAQNGSDHVDAHRTVALVVSSWTKRRYVDSSLYSTSSMLRTMELILGLKPMSQFDAAALPMYASFTAKQDLTAYVAKPSRVDLNARNIETAWGAKVSETLDFSVEDAADDLVLNEIVWKSVRGPDSVMPAPVRAGFVFRSGGDQDDDDDD